MNLQVSVIAFMWSWKGLLGAEIGCADLVQIGQLGPKLATLPGHQLPSQALGQLQAWVTRPAGKRQRTCHCNMAEVVPAWYHHWQRHLHRQPYTMGMHSTHNHCSRKLLQHNHV